MDTTMTDTLKHEEALFIPSENTEEEYVPKAAGDYLGHITDARTLTREFKKDGRTFKARIFNFKVHVAADNAHQTYTVHRDSTTKEITGEHFVGWTVVADGVFRFLEPTDGDAHESNAEGNKRYMRFCQSIGLEIPTEDRTINGKTARVQLLPDIKDTDLDGTPVVAVVGRGQDWINDAGETRPSWRVKFTKRWKEGKRLSTITTKDDLPF